MSTVAIVQARMGSSRLPGKTMKLLAGHPVLWHVINRLSHATKLDSVVVATTTDVRDDIIEEFCLAEGIAHFRGSEKDVLDRYYQAARVFKADPVARITADCPVIDPEILDEVIGRYFSGIYEAYGLAGEYPNGLDCIVYSFNALQDAWNNASLPSEREHVGPYIDKHPEKYRIGGFYKFKGLGHHRWTLDEDADYRFLTAVFDRLYKPERIFLTRDILSLLDRQPELLEINAHIMRNEGYLKSLAEDRDYLNRTELYNADGTST